jgi:hypothetical protein
MIYATIGRCAARPLLLRAGRVAAGVRHGTIDETKPDPRQVFAISAAIAAKCPIANRRIDRFERLSIGRSISNICRRIVRAVWLRTRPWNVVPALDLGWSTRDARCAAPTCKKCRSKNARTGAGGSRFLDSCHVACPAKSTAFVQRHLIAADAPPT